MTKISDCSWPGKVNNLEMFDHPGEQGFQKWYLKSNSINISQCLEFSQLNASDSLSARIVFSGWCTMLWWLWQSRAPSTILVTFSTHANSDVRFGEYYRKYFKSKLNTGALSKLNLSPKSTSGVSKECGDVEWLPGGLRTGGRAPIETQISHDRCQIRAFQDKTLHL